MLFFREPDAGRLESIRQACRDLPFNDPHVGCTRGEAPAGYNADHSRILLGHGDDTFTRARAAMQAWRMLQLGWVRPCWMDTRIEEGALVGTLAHIAFAWFVNVCRIVYVEDKPGERFAFAYGTLPGHVERGEERFRIERAEDGSVWFDILAYSKPGSWMTYVGYPVTRRLQRRFARDSLAAMVKDTAAVD